MFIDSNGVQDLSHCSFLSAVLMLEWICVCLIPWCRPALLTAAENFTVLIKNNIRFPAFNYTRWINRPKSREMQNEWTFIKLSCLKWRKCVCYSGGTFFRRWMSPTWRTVTEKTTRCVPSSDWEKWFERLGKTSKKWQWRWGPLILNTP